MKRKVFVQLILLMVLALGLSSCEKQGKERIPRDSRAIEEPDTAELFTLHYRFIWHAQAQFAGIYMAEKMGYYRERGLNVIFRRPRSTEESIRTLNSRSMDIASLDLLDVLRANDQGSKLVNIGQAGQGNALLLVAKRSRGINSIEDFQNKRIGIWRSGPNLIFYNFLKNQGIEAEFIPIEYSINLFLNDALDVVSTMYYNEYNQIIQSGLDEDELFVARLEDFGYKIPDEGLYTTQEFYKAHPKECMAFAEATMDGWLYAFSHPEETVQTILQLMHEQGIRANKAHQSWMLQKMKDLVLRDPSIKPLVQEQDYNKAVELLKEYGDIQSALPYQAFCPSAR